MAEIEKLTPEERETLAWPMPHRAEAKALRIIEQQAVEIVRLSDDLAQLRERVTKALWALDATRYNPSGSLVEWALSPEGRNLGYVVVAISALRGVAKEPREVRDVCIDFRSFNVGMSWPEWMQNRTPELLVLVGDDGTRQLLPPGVEQPVRLVSNTSYHIVCPVQTQAAPTPDYRSEPERCSCEEALALREELGAASRELQQMADRADKAEQRVAEQRERIKQDCIAAAERESECAALRARVEAAEKSLVVAVEANESLTSSTERAESECAALRADQDRQSREIARLRAELDGREARYVATQEEAIKLRAEAERLRVEAQREREHSGALVQDIEQLRRAMRAAESASAASIASLKAEVGRLRAQLPDGMQHCTIRFTECGRGHGTLVATNWVESLCRQCEVERLRAELAKLREQIGADVRRGAPRVIWVIRHMNPVSIARLANTDEWEDLGKAALALIDADAAAKRQHVSDPRTEPEHTAGCRYEQEYPALDPEDCPRCSQPAVHIDPDETDDERQEIAAGLGFGDYATMVRMLAERGWVRVGAAAHERAEARARREAQG